MRKLKEHLTLKTVAVIAAILTGLLLIAAIFGALAGRSEPSPTVTVTVEPTPLESTSPTALPTETPAGVIYVDCADVWAKLGRPITSSDPGFPSESPNQFDLDSDGIGCEDNPSTPEDESQIDWASIWAQTKGNAKDFGEWAAPKLKDFWSKLAEPSISHTWDELKGIWNGATQ